MRLNQVLILSQDVERAVAFYEALGLERLAVNYPCDARLLCPGEADGSKSGAMLAIEHTAQMPVRPNATIYFECDDIDRTVARLRARGIVFDSGPLDEPRHYGSELRRFPPPVLGLGGSPTPSLGDADGASVHQEDPSRHAAGLGAAQPNHER